MTNIRQSARFAARGTIRMAAFAGVAAAGVALSGCGLSTLTSGLGSGMFGGDDKPNEAQVAGVSEQDLLTAAKADATVTGSLNGLGTAVSAGCPKIVVSSSDQTMTIYEDGRSGDSLAVRHRGEITKTARECQIEPGRVSVKYGFSGRVLMGPKGTPGPVTLPVNVFVSNAGRATIASDQLQVFTDISVENPIGYFSAVRTVTFDLPEGTRPGEYAVNLSFANAAIAAPSALNTPVNGF